MTIPVSVLIIGGGISGCATALALHKAGIGCEIHEARESHSDGVGSFLTLGSNGVAALRMLGLDVTSVRGIDTPALHLWLGDGHDLARLPLGPVRADGMVTRTIKRSDLYSSLRDSVLELGIPVHFGHRIVSASSSADSVTATFDDGSTASGDLLIGADGLHSRVRGIIDSSAPRARYLGILNTAGYAHGVEVPGEADSMHMFFGKRGFFSYIDAGDGDVWWFANPPMAVDPGRTDLGMIDWRAALTELFEVDASPAVRLIAATESIAEPWATYDFPSVPIWHRDRMVIIGDAAHAASPSSGQGASMAIEDAAVLAMALRDSGSISDAFSAYEAVRRPRVARIVKRGKQSSNGKAPGPVGRGIRDFFMKLVMKNPPKAMLDSDWMYTYPIDWEAGLAALRR